MDISGTSKVEVSPGQMTLTAELAGPPPGYLPAGMQPQASAHGSMPSNARSAARSESPGGAPASYYNVPASVAGSRSMWGDNGNAPRARYDGGWSILALMLEYLVDMIPFLPTDRYLNPIKLVTTPNSFPNSTCTGRSRHSLPSEPRLCRYIGVDPIWRGQPAHQRKWLFNGW